VSDGRQRVIDRLRRPELAPLFDRLRARYENDAPVQSATIPDTTDAQRRAIRELLGHTRLPDGPVTVTVAELDRALAATPLGCDTRTAVELVGGPIVDRAAQRRADRQTRDQLWTWLVDHPAVRDNPAMVRWAAQTRRNGLLGTVEQTRTLLEQTFVVLDQLPSDGRSLSHFATDTCSDAHALDRGPLRTLVLRAITAQSGLPPATNGDARRQLWAAVGVACDPLSSTVIVAGRYPPPDPDLDPLKHPTVTTLTLWADVAHAAHLTAAQLAHSPIATADRRPDQVWAVENPSVIHAALRRYGTACPPMLCTSGWPSIAAVTALRQLSGAGTHVHYHGDIDAEGLKIAAWLTTKAGVTPWRMTTDHYLACIPDDAPLAGPATDVPWDATLADHVNTTGRAQLEEAVTDLLLDDLQAAATTTSRPRSRGRFDD
jgi:uncharacterized protein (TIGR02679 family)